MLIIDFRFLAAKLHMDSLSTKLSITSLKNAIDNLPQELNELYDEAFRRIDAQNEDDREVANNLLRWVAYAYRPLTIPELEEALAIVPGGEDFDPEGLPLILDALNACAGLLVVDDETKQVRMVHYTAQDYFDKLLNSRFQDAHAKIAEHCITYMSYKVFQSYKSETVYFEYDDSQDGNPEDDDVENQIVDDEAGENDDSKNDTSEDDDVENEVLDHDAGIDDASEVDESEDETSADGEKSQFHLLDYVFRYWASHATTVQGVDVSNQIYNFLAKDPRVWLKFNDSSKLFVIDPSRSSPLRPEDLLRCTGFAIAAYHGLDQALNRLLKSSTNVNELTYTGVSALHLAAYMDQVTAVNMLLEYKAKIERLDMNYMTPLCVAVEARSVNVSRLLVERGANVNAGDKRGSAPFANVEWDAPISFLQLLIENGAGLDSVSGVHGETQLCERAGIGDEETVRWLLGKGASVNPEPYLSQTPLTRAIENGSQSLVRLLLDHGAEVNPKVEWYYSPLYRTWPGGHTELGRILVDYGAQVIADNCRECKPIHNASRKGDMEALITLLNSGGDIQAHCEDGTALHIAASCGYRDCVDLLMERGANVNAQGREDYTPLMSIIAGMANSDTPDDGSFLGIINSLLEAHTDVDKQNKYGMTALHMATANGDVMVIHLLLKHHSATSIRSSLNFSAEYIWEWCFPCGDFSFSLSSRGATRVALFDPVSVHKVGDGYLKSCQARDIGNTVSECRAWESGLTALDVAILGDHLECIRILEPLTGARTPSTTMPHQKWLFELTR